MDSLQERIDGCRDMAAQSAPRLESLAAADPMLSVVQVFDDVLPDPLEYRARALTLPFNSVPIAEGVVFHGIAPCADPTLPDALRRLFPGVDTGLTFFRQSPAGQPEPNYIHTDRDMGDWTAILYLNPEPAEGDGTTFWESRETGVRASQAKTEADFRAEWPTWRDLSAWRRWRTVDAKFNRLLVFSAPMFHSRAIHENYGTAGVDARLIQLVFGRGLLTCV